MNNAVYTKFVIGSAQKTKQSAPNTYQRSQKYVPQNPTITRYLPEML